MQPKKTIATCSFFGNVGMASSVFDGLVLAGPSPLEKLIQEHIIWCDEHPVKCWLQTHQDILYVILTVLVFFITAYKYRKKILNFIKLIQSLPNTVNRSQKIVIALLLPLIVFALVLYFNELEIIDFDYRFAKFWLLYFCALAPLELWWFAK